MRVEVLAIVHRDPIVGGEQILQHFDGRAAALRVIRACRCALPGVTLQPQVSHMDHSAHPTTSGGGRGRPRLRHAQLDAAQAQLIARDDAGAVPAADAAEQAVGRRLRLRTADRGSCTVTGVRFNR